MAVSAQTTAVISVFTDRRQAERYVDALKRAGFTDEEIGMLSPAEESRNTYAGEGAAAGVLTGGAVGALAGAVATGLIPGIGPVIATGILLGVLGGAAAGAAAGGLLGTLIGLGIPENEALEYEREFRAGRTIVIVQSDGRNAHALAILQNYNGASRTR